MLPGTPVPGYRLCRPFGTALLQVLKPILKIAPEPKGLRQNSTSLRGQLYGLRKSSVLYQGTTLVGPHTIEKKPGFSP